MLEKEGGREEKREATKKLWFKSMSSLDQVQDTYCNVLPTRVNCLALYYQS